ncbi:uncharacterized protein BXZ73DRAFT_43580 [Epithele typhae]|uniref:uncharacterized protein n=1 Tax=Epithele typhae TaxID=378194 RepID=UPI00200889F7|nr:uncharacterized protein BXZ73DRAFT_43580 [Epithele typhae]KAH9939711.1 hypothetical protein BXZ73DRAFT_43580 [Epithele typhae]
MFSLLAAVAAGYEAGYQDSAVERNCYRPSGQGDIFLFSPSIGSRSSGDSGSLESSSFDALSYAYSPSDPENAVKHLLSPAPRSTARSSTSPFPSDSRYLAHEDGASLQHTPGTASLHEIFNSSPAGYWQPHGLSPISRHSRRGRTPSDEDVDVSDERPGRKLVSLIDYKNAREALDSPEPTTRPSSPSSLSALSSIPSSPSMLFSFCAPSSSQTSVGRSPASSPCNRSSVVSPLQPSGRQPSRSLALPPQPSLVNAGRRLGPATRSQKRALSPEPSHQPNSRVKRARIQPAYSSFEISPSPARVQDQSHDENYQPSLTPARKMTRDRPPSSLGYPSVRRKRIRMSSPVASSSKGPRQDSAVSNSATDAETPSASRQRNFPLHIPVNGDFPLFYRRFPASSVVDKELARYVVHSVQDATPNSPRSTLDLYTPRFVKGKGPSKVGLCPICHESVKRGGEGKRQWLSMKFSAFNYHMQYAHGISATTGLPFSPPIAFRTVTRTNPGKHEKAELQEGKCHKCKKWVAVEGIKDVQSKVPEIFWWKHAAACHQGSTILGESNVFIEDVVYAAVFGQLARSSGDENSSGEGQGC